MRRSVGARMYGSLVCIDPRAAVAAYVHEAWGHPLSACVGAASLTMGVPSAYRQEGQRLFEGLGRPRRRAIRRLCDIAEARAARMRAG